MLLCAILTTYTSCKYDHKLRGQIIKNALIVAMCELCDFLHYNCLPEHYAMHYKLLNIPHAKMRINMMFHEDEMMLYDEWVKGQHSIKPRVKGQ